MSSPTAAVQGLDELDTATDLAAARTFVVDAEVSTAAEAHRTRVLAFVDAHADALHRSCLDGHLTGSALVVDAAGERVVVLHHRKLDIWVQPGGHADGEANLARAALIEALEETGIDGLLIDPVAIDIDVHEVRPPKEGPHLHLDVRFLVVAPPGAELVGNHESKEIRWVRPDEIEAIGGDAGLIRLVDHGLRRLSGSRS